MVICKNAQVGGKVSTHDDSTFLYTDPLSAMGYWFALADCTTQNGCLSFVYVLLPFPLLHSRGKKSVNKLDD